MKKSISVILAIFMLLSAFPLISNAVTIVDSGICGENLTWTLDNEGTLIISGIGAMDDYKNGNPPFKKDDVKTLIIENGVTKLCKDAFYGFNNLTNVSIADSVIDMGTRTFAFCSNLEAISIGKSVKSIGN